MSPCPEPMSLSLKNNESKARCLDLSCIQTVNLKEEFKTFHYIDNDEIPGFFAVILQVKISRLSWLRQSQPIGKKKRALRHLAIDV